MCVCLCVFVFVSIFVFIVCMFVLICVFVCLLFQRKMQEHQLGAAMKEGATHVGTDTMLGSVEPPRLCQWDSELVGLGVSTTLSHWDLEFVRLGFSVTMGWMIGHFELDTMKLVVGLSLMTGLTSCLDWSNCLSNCLPKLIKLVLE